MVATSISSLNPMVINVVVLLLMELLLGYSEITVGGAVSSFGGGDVLPQTVNTVTRKDRRQNSKYSE